ncbi:hypothetical protein HDR60_03025 [bacterium]|nr:hypothetical protein [bacterium]
MSTFTNWNGPQGSDVRAKDLIEFANAYSELVSKIDNHIKDVGSTDDPHKIKEYVAQQLADFEKNKIPSLAGYLKTSDAESTYAKEEDIPDLSGYLLSANADNKYAAKDGLSEYLKASDLKFSEEITSINDYLKKLKSWLKSSDKSDSLDLINTETLSAQLVSANTLSGLVHAIGQINFEFSKFSSNVCGSDEDGVYYMLGMLKENAGTAYIEYVNTKPFSAVVHFAASKKDGAYCSGQLDVLANFHEDEYHGVRFMVVQGTAKEGEHHAYLAVRADEWTKVFEDNMYGVFSALEFRCAGINFAPVGSEGYVSPNGETKVVASVEYTGLSDKVENIESNLKSLTNENAIGEITFWPRCDDNGVAIDVPDWAHACDGSSVDESLTDLIELIGDTYPLQDYSIIRIKKAARYDERRAEPNN